MSCYFITVVIHSGEELDKSKLGSIQRVAYISPKLRDVKSLFHLKYSKLHSHIVDPQPPQTIWNPNAVIPQHHSVSYVSKVCLIIYKIT
jgi:hypothetical protein